MPAGAFAVVVFFRVQPFRPKDALFDKAIRDNQECLQGCIIGGKAAVVQSGISAWRCAVVVGSDRSNFERLRGQSQREQTEARQLHTPAV